MSARVQSKLPAAFVCGALVGVLGGLIGLGGAEFRLPLLITAFAFAALQAVILNKAVSLVVVASALVLRHQQVPIGELAPHWQPIATLLIGTVIGAWLAAGWALRWRAEVLHRVIAVLLVLIAAVLTATHVAGAVPHLGLGPHLTVVAGVAAGLAIGAVASLMGVAGGELLIPTLILLFGVDVKTAGSLSLLVSLPTMLVGLARYSGDGRFAVIRREGRFVLSMAVGSVLGVAVGAALLGVVPSTLLLPALSGVLVLSAWRMWHR